MSAKLTLRQLFESLQDELGASLRATRSVLSHPTSKGLATEDSWRKMLATHLPNRYCVESGRVVDSEGSLSDDIDVIIFDGQYSPLLFKRDSTCYVPAESVYGVFEVKQELTKRDIEYAGAKVASVRRLRRTSAPIHHAGGRYEPKPLHRILGGILTSESGWTSELGPQVETAMKGLDEEERLELGIALSAGAFETVSDDDGSLQVTTSEPRVALISLFLALIKALQNMGTVPAIDIAEYARALQQE